jgi:quercetin dioxygenase-like cupin family protein
MNHDNDDLRLPPLPIIEDTGAGRARLLAALSPQHGPWDDYLTPLRELTELSIPSLRRLLASLLTPDAWSPIPFPGVELCHVDESPRGEEAIIGFVRIEPGAVFPEHAHAGIEYAFVIQGVLLDTATPGVLHGPGTLRVMPPDTEHQISASPDHEPLIYLTVSERGIRFGELFIGPDSPLF